MAQNQYFLKHVYTRGANFLLSSRLEGVEGGAGQSAATEDATRQPRITRWANTRPGQRLLEANSPVEMRLPLLTKLGMEARVSWLKQKPPGMEEERGGSESFRGGRNHSLLHLPCGSRRMNQRQAATIGSRRGHKARAHPAQRWLLHPTTSPVIQVEAIGGVAPHRPGPAHRVSVSMGKPLKHDTCPRKCSAGVHSAGRR